MDSKAQKADKLIKDYAFRSSLTGFIPVPFIDTVGLISVQRLMLMRLSKLYGVPFSKHLAKAGLTTLMSGLASKAASPLVGSALKMIPGVGTLAGGASMAAMGGASTYAVGKVFQQHFEKGGTLEDFDPGKAKEDLNMRLEEGKQLSKKGAVK
ncbi:MAG: Unknown protein [uncultured Thiotrichaceae bacterium]|uniref:GTPase n=1 Tax=uncultured Thiotrichaceae bacterium TaxID=298394 RepID=A0A6S6U155_9GAMM|nr:MAG: Unknown protein [uncultured Thiotrichaceae bacterium]